MMRFSLLTLCFLASCGHHHGDHEREHSHEPDVHQGLEAISVTLWSERSELFLEYEPPVVGREGKFAAHLTSLPEFKAVTEGSMVLSLRMEDGASISARAEAPSNPGIFRLALRPVQPGKCSLHISVTGAQVTEEIDGGACEVFANEHAAQSASSTEATQGARIAFTKEQQWKTDFATALVSERSMKESVLANAEIRPVAGKEARLTASATGRVTLASQVPVIGMSVQSGQLLASISPRLSVGGDRASLDAEEQAARAELTAAETQAARAERLLQEEAIPKRNVEEAQARVQVARSRLHAAQGRLAQYSIGAQGLRAAGRNAFQIRSPIQGTLVATSVATGESVEEGALLFTVIDLTRIWLEARIFEPDIPQVEKSESAWFTVEGYEEPFIVDAQTGRLVTVGRVVDPLNRTVPLIFELDNPQGKLRIGQFAKIGIHTGKETNVLAVPASAVIEDAGKRVVYVQAEGEAFERRPVVLGVRSEGWVGVLDGLSAKDRVVTRGAYELKLTAATGAIPQHAHVH
jgi:RND family efflux transporter MFP subunit